VTRLSILLAALAVIARTRVAVLPGWVVPVPALILAAEIIACAAGITWLVLRLRSEARPRTAPAGGWS